MLRLAVVVLGTWTLVSFAVALVLGETIRRLRPIPVRTTRRH